MRVVFVHPSGPAQFQHLAAALVDEGCDVAMLAESLKRPIEGARFHRLPKASKAGDGPAPLVFADRYARNGHRTAEALEKVARAEGRPDLVVGHLGWGDLLFARDVLPDAAIVGYCEYFFQPAGGDVGFDPASPPSSADRRRLRARNMAQLASLEAITAGMSPTRWQRSRFPSWAQRDIAVCHEGVDTELCRPGTGEGLTMPDGRVLSHGDPVVTYAARSLEPYRGFPQFMRAAAIVSARRPDASFVVVGGDDVSYGNRPPNGGTWREMLTAESGIDPSRILFTGRVEHRMLVNLFRLSSVHVYLTVPFVLSWSMLEAMACGCLVIGSATPPVEEVIEDGRNGLLVDFWSADSLADGILEALRAPDRFRPLRREAIRTIAEDYALPDCVDRQRALLRRLVA